MGNTRLMIAAVLGVVIATPCGVNAQYGHRIYLSDNIDGGDYCCRFLDSAPSVRQFYVLVSSVGSVAAQFSAPLPECMVGAIYLSDTNVFPITIGDSQIGVAIGFDGCRSGNAIHVLTINCLMQGLTEECCYYSILPYPDVVPDRILFVDCDDNQVEGSVGHALVVKTPGTRLENPYPPDGAGGQPLDVTLSWWESRCDCRSGEVFIDVYFGTSVDPPLVAHLNTIPYEFPYDPGLLQLNTTYYWKLESYGVDVRWTSPLWSFSTGSGVPTHSTRWGAIKALYIE